MHFNNFSALSTAWKMSVFGVFLGCIFPPSDWIRRDSFYNPYLSICSSNAWKYGPEKLGISTLFTQCNNILFNFGYFKIFCNINLRSPIGETIKSFYERVRYVKFCLATFPIIINYSRNIASHSFKTWHLHWTSSYFVNGVIMNKI